METPVGREKRSYGNAGGDGKETPAKKEIIKKPPPKKRLSGGMEKRVVGYLSNPLTVRLTYLR